MKVAILQHEAGEQAGFFETVFQEQGVPLHVLRLFELQEVPLLEETHLLIMGGSMSVHDEREFPFLRDEKRLIRNYVRQGLPMLGICLGAQLIADAFGSKVYPYRKELGWTSFIREPGIDHSFLPPKFYAFQLHRDTFDVPAGGTLLCTGEMVRNQAFRIGSAWGFQFHVEMTDSLIEDWIRDCEKADKDRIHADTVRFLFSSHSLCRRIGKAFLHRWSDPNS
jgi:GMP synthase (glutamine-hydrolysing)